MESNNSLNIISQNSVVVEAPLLKFNVNNSLGTNGQVLTSDGTNATWQDMPSKVITDSPATQTNIPQYSKYGFIVGDQGEGITIKTENTGVEVKLTFWEETDGTFSIRLKKIN